MQHLGAHQTQSTVSSIFNRVAGELRVSFTSTDPNGFTIDELEALEGAIIHARRRMLDDTPELAVVHPPADDSLDSRFREQLRQMQPTPT